MNTHIDEPPPLEPQSGVAGSTRRTSAAGLAVEERDALITALRHLPEGQRRVVVLRHWLGLTVEETAHDLGCSTGTVKSQNARAVQRLRGELQRSSPAQEDDYERAR